MLWILPISLLVVFEIIADVFSKEYSLHGHWYLWVGAIVGYIIANIFFLSAMKNGSGLARGAIIFSVASAILAATLGIYFYHEHTNKIQLIGMLLGIVSIILIFWE
jgi:multidrug transporter EmrE-like cation transporter